MIKYLVPIIVILGYFLGYIVKYFTRDELRSGRKWFKMIEKVLMVILAIGCLYYIKLSWSLVIGALLGYFTIKYLKPYFYFGILSFLSFKFTDAYFIIINSLMFIFGLAYGSRKKDYFVLLFFVFVLLFFIPINFNLFFGICCGAFIKQYYLI